MARNFNGTSDFISTVLTPAMLTGGSTANPFSIAAWAYAATGHPSFPLICAVGGNTAQIFFGINIGSFAGFNLYYSVGQSSNATVPTTNVWHHVLATYNGNTSTGIQLYVDGANAGGAQSNVVGGIGSGTITTIGDNSAGNSFWQGRLADLTFWTVALSAAEAQALARGTRPYVIRPKSILGYLPLDGLASPEPDLSGLANNGTLTGTSFAFGPPTTLFTPRKPQFTAVAAPITPPNFALMPQAIL